MPKPRGMIAGQWWALLRGPASLPCLFASRRDAKENRDSDEYLVQVTVSPSDIVQVVRGRRYLLAKKAAEKAPKKGAKRAGR